MSGGMVPSVSISEVHRSETYLAPWQMNVHLVCVYTYLAHSLQTPPLVLTPARCVCVCVCVCLRSHSLTVKVLNKYIPSS